MSITQWMPWRRKEQKMTESQEGEHPIDLLELDMNRMFDNFFSGFGLASFGTLENEWATFSPRVDIVDSEKEVKVSVELPGIDEQDIEVSLMRDVLTISGEKRQEKEDRGKNYHRMERSYGAFKRSISLMCDIDEDKVDARFKNGVLTVTLPKSVEGQCRQTIKIKAQ